MRTLEQMQRLCAKDHPRCARPFIRRRGKAIWTVAACPFGMLAVRGALTDNEEGLGKPSNARAIFRRSRGRQVDVAGWRPPTRASWAELSEFLRTKREPLPLNGAEPVSVFGVRLNAKLARKLTRGLKANTVQVRVSPDSVTCGVSGEMTPNMIRIDARDWSVLVMAAIFTSDQIRAEFPLVRP